MSKAPLTLSDAAISRAIHTIRGQRVMLDEDLAQLYGVPTKRLNEAVKRNAKRFPADFLLILTAEETAALRSQSATSKGRGGRRYLPRAFTQEGVAMLSCVLNSARAIDVNVGILRAFVRLRSLAAANAEVLHRLGIIEMEVQRTKGALDKHTAKTKEAFQVVSDALRRLAHQPPPEPEAEPEPMGFRTT